MYNAWQLSSLHGAMRHMRGIIIVQAYSIVSNETTLPWFINKISHWKVDSPTFQWSQRARDIGWQNKISVCLCYCIQLKRLSVLTIGQRSLFFPEIKSHSKSRDMNHSYLRINQQDEEKKTWKNPHINTCKRMHKFHQDLIVLLNLIGELPVRHWAKVRIGGGGGGGQLLRWRWGVVFDWSIYPMFRLRNGDSIKCLVDVFHWCLQALESFHQQILNRFCWQRWFLGKYIL